MQDIDFKKNHNVWDEIDETTRAKVLRLKKRTEQAKIKIDEIDLFSARICLYLGWDAYQEFKTTAITDIDKINEFTRLLQASELLVKQKMQILMMNTLASASVPHAKNSRSASNKVINQIKDLTKQEMEGLE